jgi:PAS domain S-box-containing protein
MTAPLIKRSIRWRLLVVMIGISVLFSITLTVIHTRAVNVVMAQTLKHIFAIDKSMLIERGHMIALDLKRQVENDITSFRDTTIQEEVSVALEEHTDISFVIIVEAGSKKPLFKAVRSGINDPSALIIDYNPATPSSVVREYGTGKKGILEFIEPIHLGSDLWGILRLGVSTAPLNIGLAKIQSEMSATSESMIARSIRYSVLFVLAGILIILYVSGKLTEPITRLTASAQEIAHGNFNAATGLSSQSQDEVGRLSSAFIKMADDLQRSYSELKQVAEDARRTETFLDSIVENLPHMIFVKDARELKFTLVNKAGENMVGQSRANLLGKSDYDFFPREQAEFFTRIDREVLNSHQSIDIPDETLTTRDGNVRYLHTRKIPIHGPDGQAQYLLGISEDITDQKSAAEERRLFFNHAMDLMCIANLDGYFQQVNPAFVEALGYTSEELCSHPFIDFVHPDDRDNTMAAARKLSEGKIVVAFDNRYFCKDGSIRWLTWNATANIEMKKIYAVARDTTEQRKMEEQIIQAGLKEQERIAHDLHDGLGQILTGLAYKGKLIEQMLLAGEKPVAAQAAEIVRLANRASEQARSLARGLDPVVLREGLVMALNDLAHTTKEVFGIECYVEHDAEGDGIEKITASQLYRIAQEAVNNAVKHSKSKIISIYLTNDRTAVTLVVMNDGPELTGEIKRKDGLGFQTMHYRTKMIGGALAIIPSPTGGLIVRCTVRKHDGIVPETGTPT